MRKRKPVEMVADRPSMELAEKPNLINSRLDWMLNDENKRIRRLLNGMDQAIENNEMRP